MKVDLHYHGMIGFMDFWRDKQGYAGKNILRQIIESASEKDIGMFALISEFDEIPKGSFHDRFNYLLKNYSQGMDRNKFDYEKLGDKDIAAVLIDKEKGKKIIMLNGQTVIVEEDGRRYDHLVIGTNQVPNHLGLEDTLKIAQDMGAVQIAEHPFGINGIGEENLGKYREFFDAIEGHNAQFCFDGILSKIPPFSQYSRKINEKAQNFAFYHLMPWIATSDGHRIEDIGTAFIELFLNYYKPENEERIIDSLKENLRKKLFLSYKGYPNQLDNLKTKFQIITGVNSIKHYEELSRRNGQIPLQDNETWRKNYPKFQ